jgi:hypothetical protein
MRGRAMCSMTTSVNGIHSGSPQTHGQGDADRRQ